MEEIQQNKQAQTMKIGYFISMVTFIACNLFELSNDKYGYFILFILVVSIPLLIISSLLFWITKLLMNKAEKVDKEQRETVYWTTYINYF